MRKTLQQMYFVCPTRLTTMRLSPGLPINGSPNWYVSTQGKYAPITPRLSGLSSGTFYRLTFDSSSSSAPLHKRVLTAYLAALKTSDERLAAKCEKTIVEASLSDFFPSLAQMDRLTIRQS